MSNEISDYPKVLLAAPTSHAKNYCFWDWLINIKTFTYPNLDILLVDNSPGKEYFEYLKKSGVRTMHVNPGNRATQEFITESQNLIRDVVLEEGYDYLFSLESDVFPTVRDIVERLMDNDVEMVTAPYMIGQGKDSGLLIGYQVESFVQKNALFGVILPANYGFYMMDGSLKAVNQPGIGCTLIRRDILEQLKFRCEKGQAAHSDSYFYTDLWYLGITAYMDTGLYCHHQNADWGLIHNTWRESI